MNSAVESEPAAGAGRPPEGRYGRTADERADRRLKSLGAVLGALLLAVVGWFGWDYVAGQRLSGEIIKFKVVSARAVEVHLEVRKDADTKGYYTLRSRSADGAEVGRADFHFDEDRGRVDKVVTLRTTARGTNAELVGCQAD